ncbi:MAG: hypothetical protein HFE97_03070 [Oscillospiraceae bacterium]|nr:hypothetical protein [Oscillospiraceae bacterium]
MAVCQKGLPRLLAGLAVFGGLSGLALVRLWAILGGRLPGKLLLLLAMVLAGGCLALLVRFHLVERLLPWGWSWKSALAALLAFVPGALLDTSFAMFSSEGLLIDSLPFRLLSALGSGLVLAGIVLALVKAARTWGTLQCPCGKELLLLALAVNVITALYSGGSATVYYWDATIYWNSSTMLAGQPLDLAQIRLVLESVITQEYNYLLSFPVSLVMRVLGTGRYVYLFAAVNLYVLPALWGICVLGKRLRRGGLLPVLASPMLLYTALVGFVDVAAAGLGIWAFVCYSDTSRPAWARGILSGALLTGTFLLRRYFFFFAVSFGIAALIANLVFRRKQWRDFFALFLSAAVTSLFFAQSFLIEKVLSVRYGDLYAAYNQGRRVDVMMLTRYFGVIPLAAVLVLGLFLLIRVRSLRWTAILALLQPLICLLLFTQIQSHGQQHLLLYLPAFVTLLSSGLEALPERKPIPILAALLAACTTVSSLLPTPQPASPQEIRFPAPLPSFTYHPPRRQDIAQLIALRMYVDGLSAQEPKTAAIVSSSFVFNDSIYTNALRSMDIPAPDGPETKLIYMATVDKRDGFSWNILTADYLVVGDPVQTHLGAENQRILTLVADAVLSGTGLGTAYEPLKATFPLDSGVTIRIYRRIRDITPAEAREISNQLVALYPDYAAQYQPPTWALE